MRAVWSLPPTLALCASFASLAGCALYSFDECSRDEDCPIVSGTRLSCTSEHLCVQGTPAEKICNQTVPKDPLPGAVPFGVIMRLSAQSGSDKFPFQAVQLAAEEINSYAQTGQRPVVLHVCDSGRSGFDARTAMRVLVGERKVVGVVGPSTSSEVISVAQVAGDGQVPLISPSATAPALANLPQKDYVYKMAPSDVEQGQAMARVVIKGTVSPKVGLLYVNDAYGQGLRGAFVSALPSGTQVTPFEFTEKSPGDAVQRLVAMGNQLTDVIVIANLDVPAIVEGLLPLPLGMAPVRILMTDGAKNDSLLDQAKANFAKANWKEHLSRISGTAPTVSRDKVFDDFESAFLGRFQMSSTSDAFAPYAYDAFYALAIALGNAREGASGPLVAAGLKRLTGNAAPIPVGRSQYQNAYGQIAAGKSVPLAGVSGPIRFSAGSREGGLFEQWGVDMTDPQRPRYSSKLAP